MIKVIKDLNDHTNQCIARGDMFNVYHIVIRSEWFYSASFTLCKDCLKELHTAIPEEVIND